MLRIFLCLGLIFLNTLISPCLSPAKTLVYTGDKFHSIYISKKHMTRIIVPDPLLPNGVIYTDENLNIDYGKGENEIRITVPESFSSGAELILITKSHKYGLYLISKDIPPSVIRIKHPVDVSEKANSWEKSLPYTTLMVELVMLIATGEKPTGYKEENINSKHEYETKDKTIKIKPLKRYLGSSYYGYLLYLSNISDKSIRLKASDAYELLFLKGSRAGYIDPVNLKPGAGTMAVLVSDRKVF